MKQIQQFPPRMDALPVDRSNMRLCQVAGLFLETARVGGTERPFLTYLAPGLESDRNVLLVAPPSGAEPVAFLEESGLLALADRERFFLHLLLPGAGGWDLSGADADYFHAVFAESVSRTHYVTMIKQDNFYALGVGDGAAVALQAATRRPLPRRSADGRDLPPLSPDSDLFSALGLAGPLPEEALAFARPDQCPTPVWLFAPERGTTEEACLDYWRAVNRCEDLPFSGDGADALYRPSPVRARSEVNRESIAQVRFTAGDLSAPGALDRLVRFLFSVRRHVSYGGKKDLRYFKDAESLGARLRTLTVDGWGRRWYEYVPRRVLEAGKPAPLVLTLHARGMDAAGFFDISGMSCVAEERGFICCFPESGVYQQRPGALPTLPLWSGFYGDTPFDDVKFLRALVEDVAGRLPVDRSRIYACGQSSGGMMCSELAWYASDLFAAVACWSGLWMDKEKRMDRPLSQPPIPLLFLYGDRDWLVAGREPDPEFPFSVCADMRPRLAEFMERHRLRTPPAHYACAPIDYYVYRDEAHVPMLQVGVVRDMPHCNYPEESWISWDQFFCKFRRAPDGSVCYLDQPAR